MHSQLKNLRQLVVAITAALVAGTTSAHTFYVDAQKGRDANAGSPEAPWKTIQRAADFMRPGDTVRVAGGNYPERVYVTRSGATDRPITYQVSGKVVMRGFTITASYIRVMGFEITNHIRIFQDSYGIYVIGEHNALLNNYIHDLYNEGIMLSGGGDPNSPVTSYNVVRGNRIYRASTCGITVEGRRNLIQANDIGHVVQYPPGGPPFDGADADGIRPFGRGHIIRDNHVHDIWPSDLGNLDPHIDGIETWGPASDITLERNVFDLNGSYFLPVQGAQIENSSGVISHITFRNNIFMDARMGIHVEQIESTRMSSILVVNNTFYRITHYGVLLEGCPQAVIENNAFYDAGSYTDSYLGLSQGSVVYNRGSYLGPNRCSKAGLVVGYNSQSMSDGRPPGRDGSHAPYPHDLWMANPEFANAAAKDFRLLPTSPLVDAGLVLKDVGTDLTGVVRQRGNDIGAYEHQR
jgi:hypothetical protein